MMCLFRSQQEMIAMYLCFQYSQRKTSLLAGFTPLFHFGAFVRSAMPILPSEKDS